MRVLSSIPGGGSRWGMSFYSKAADCGRKAQLYTEEYRDYAGEDIRTIIPHPKKARDRGTVIHKLLELYHGEKVFDIAIEQNDTPWDEICTDALRVFKAYTKQFPPDAWGRVVGCEMDLKGAAVEEALISPWTGRADMVVEMSGDDVMRWADADLELPGPGIYIIDHKTAGRKDDYAQTFYDTSVQFMGYQVAWNAVCPEKPCQGLIANRINCTATPTFQQFFRPYPTDREVVALRRWLRWAKARADEGAHNLTRCSWCEYYQDGKCDRI